MQQASKQALVPICTYLYYNYTMVDDACVTASWPQMPFLRNQLPQNVTFIQLYSQPTKQVKPNPLNPNFSVCGNWENKIPGKEERERGELLNT